MKTNNIVKNVLTKGIHIVAIISAFIIIQQLNQNKEKINLAERNEIEQKTIQQEEKVSEKTSEMQSRVTSRYSMIRNGIKNIEQQIEEKQELLIVEEQYTKIEDLTISKDMDLTIRTGLSKSDFKTLISNVKQDSSKFFYDNSDMIYDLCEKYQINEIFFCGLISAESGWNIASNHRRTHNYISLMSKNGLIQYNSVEEGLEIAAKTLHNNYLTEGGRFYHGKTLYGVKTKFCPASSTWVNLVYGRMEQIIKSI